MNQSRWKLELKTACTLSLNTTSQSRIAEHIHISLSTNQYNFNVRYHLKDVIVGKIYFLLVRIKIKNMELSIVKRESAGAGNNQHNESETITKFEIMDGAPGTLHPSLFSH